MAATDYESCLYIWLHLTRMHDSIYGCNWLDLCVRVTRLTTLHMAARYGVATMSRLLKKIGLFCKRALQKRRYSAKKTYNFKAPTHRSHPMPYISIYKWHDFWLAHPAAPRLLKMIGLFCKRALQKRQYWERGWVNKSEREWHDFWLAHPAAPRLLKMIGLFCKRALQKSDIESESEWMRARGSDTTFDSLTLQRLGS